jgi:hypothetical protein
MHFVWDESKNESNIRKHGFDFANAHEMFTALLLSELDDRMDYGQDRWIGIGMIRGRVAVVAYTERDEETIRIISLRKALRHERIRYEQAIRNELGAR